MKQKIMKRLLAGMLLASVISTSGVIPSVKAEGSVQKQAEKTSLTNSNWEELSSILNKAEGVWENPTFSGAITSELPDTALMGNGDVGITSAGSKTEKSYLISKGDFWSCGWLGEKSTVSAGNRKTKLITVGGLTIRESEEKKERENVSLTRGENVTVSESSHVSSSQPNTYYLSKYVVDGKILNKNMDKTGTSLKDVPGEGWASGPDKGVSGQGSPADNEKWIQIDLGEEKSISKYIVYHAQSVFADRPHQNTKAFKMEYSLDGKTWTLWDEVTNNTAAKTIKAFDRAIRARYIKLDVEIPSQNTDTRARIAEIELFENADDISIFDDTASSVSIEKETQSIKNAEVITDMSIAGVPVSMNAWLSATENTFITEIESKGDETVSLEVDVWVKKGDSSEKHTQASGVNEEGGYAWASRKTGNLVPNNPKSWYSETAIMTKVLGEDDVRLERGGNESSRVRFELKAGEKKYLITTIGGGGQTYDYQNHLTGKAPIDEAKELMDARLEISAIEKLKEEHQNWWKEYWNKSYINIGDDQFHEYYYKSTYYIGCTARADKVAPGLYGIWITTDSPQWCGDYHQNYNYYAPFYGMYSSNRYESTLALLQPVLDYMDTGVENAKNLLATMKIDSPLAVSYVESRADLADGIEDGILIPVGLGPWGIVAINRYMDQTINAPFSASAFISYYNYSQDNAFLADKAYPFLEKIANFYSQWCEKEDLGDGNYRYVLYDGAHEDIFNKNAGVTIGLVQNVYETLIKNYEVLRTSGANVNEDKLNMWKDMYDHISDVPVRQYTGGSFNGPVFALSEDGDIIWSASASVNLEFVHPGDRLTFDSDPKLLEIGRNTVTAKEAVNKNIWGQMNNNPKIYTHAIRLGYDPQYVMEKFRSSNLNGMRENGSIHDGYHGIEKAGAIEFINNMLLQSSNGIIKVFPNWTGADASFTTLREKGAFLVSSEMKEGTVQYVKLTSEKGGDARLVNPWGNANVAVTDSNGNKVAYTWGNTENSGEKTIEFATQADETYTIAFKETDKTKLEALYDEYKDMQKSGYETETWDVFQKALKNAKAVLESPEADQDTVDTATAELRKAIEGLRASKKTLEYYLTKAKAHVANGDVDGLVASVQKLFATAITEGEAVRAKEDATLEEVTEATAKLMLAIHGLDMKAGDKTDLTMALELTATIDLTKYVEAGQAEYLAAKEAAEVVMADGDAFQDAVDEAWGALVEAIANLRLKADKAVLEALLNSVKALDLSLYTEESVAVFRTALARANAVMADATLSENDQKVVDQAVKALADAKDALKLKDTGATGDNGNGEQTLAPKTGDDSMAVTLGCLFAVIAMAGAGILCLRRRKTE